MAMVLDQAAAFLWNQWIRVRRLGWHEIRLLLAALLVVFCAYLFIKLTDEVQEGETQKFDDWLLRSLRRADDPGVPIGPPWLREAALDATALGSPLVLTLVVLAVAGFMLLQKLYRMLRLTLVTVTSGVLLSVLLKYLIERDRPDVVPHLREVSTPSFPSGHAMLSAIVYLTLGTMLAHIVRGRLAKIYWLLWAMLLTFLVGVSRVYLGVHYPTDVLAGWIAGLVWALTCWLSAQYLRHRPRNRQTS
jgi:undecaprenyl-diphosphatase